MSSKMRYLLAVFSVIVMSKIQAQEIVVNKGKYSDYYHMMYKLESGKYKINSNYGFNEGGQFEVLVPKQYFSVPAPNCKENIIIRMPWSDNETKKQALYKKLVAQKEVNVVLELNPYINLVNKKPLKVELQYCNVFFRHRSGDYYDSL
ncbi:hypothetical protein H0A36_26240 [Endozoicomonas sp. SM1973]|uniref:Uncharacterized protein n=2 Tax=Spartinivicinus marinus TaxID=2994442 RepID=A0A853ICE4_9GAMM|nr:hypothetical protein [Spartinivicinus marinus]